MPTSAELLTPTAAEKELIKAAVEGVEAELRGRGNGRRPVIRAEVLRALCTGAIAGAQVKDRIRMTDGTVRGILDLSGANLAYGMRFKGCVFERSIDLRRARAAMPVELDGGETGQILADEFESEANLIIRDIAVAGRVSLRSAWIRGDVRLSGSRIRGRGARAFCGDDLRVGGALFLDGENFHAQGEVCLRSARIAGQLNCRQAGFSSPSGYSIGADHIEVGGDVLLEDGFRADGEVCLQWAKVGRLSATGGSITSPSTFALHADALRAENGVYLDRGFRATGMVRLIGANITGELCCTGGSFRNPSDRALDAERIVAEDVYLDRGFTAYGEVRFNDAKISRQVNATRGEFCHDRGGEYALNCDGLRCGGAVFLNDGFSATGEVRLTDADIGSDLNCTSGLFRTPGGRALFADGLSTLGNVYLDQDFEARGEVRFARATIGRQLVCTNGHFDNQHGTALDLTGLITQGDVLVNAGFRATGGVRMRNADITRDLNFSRAQMHGTEGLDARGITVGDRLIWKLDHPPEGRVDLSFGQLGRLDDTMPSWPPENYVLAGLNYRPTMGSPDEVPVGQRLAWLHQTRDYARTAYEQLAQAYKLSGQESTAEKVSIAGLQDLRKRGNLRRPSQAWNWFLDITVGYGYRLHRPFLALLVFWLIGSVFYYLGARADVIFSTQGSTHVSANAACPAGYPCFNPVVYSFQLLIPFLDLREVTYWWPESNIAPWGFPLAVYTWFMIAVGWLVGVALIPGASAYFRRQ